MTKTDERYPAPIGMFCDNDGCEIDIVRDYLVRASDDWPTRVAYARSELRREGWVCDGRGDFCPEHAPIQFIIIKQSWAGTLEKLCHGYDWDGTRYVTQVEAVAAGWKMFGHDDFNIGHVQGNKLVWFGWMDEPINETDEDFAVIAKDLDLTPARSKEAV